MATIKNHTTICIFVNSETFSFTKVYQIQSLTASQARGLLNKVRHINVTRERRNGMLRVDSG